MFGREKEIREEWQKLIADICRPIVFLVLQRLIGNVALFEKCMSGDEQVVGRDSGATLRVKVPFPVISF